MNVVGYIRVSTVTQAREGESLEAQRRQVTSYAASKGLVLPDETFTSKLGLAVAPSSKSVQRVRGSLLLCSLVTW